MSKKPQKSPKKGDKGKQETSYPICINKQEARMVCLSEDCSQHPFFCSNCEDSSCEIAHQHSDKLVSVSYKEFSKRVLKEKKPIDALGSSMESYREVLAKLKQDVSEFIEKQLANLDEIANKASEVAEEDQSLIQKLKQQQYEGFTGGMMDQLWTNCADDMQKIQAQQQTAQFIKIKQQQVKGISQHFEHLNQMAIDNIPQDEEQSIEKGKKKKAVSSNSNNKK